MGPTLLWVGVVYPVTGYFGRVVIYIYMARAVLLEPILFRNIVLSLGTAGFTFKRWGDKIRRSRKDYYG